MDPDSLAKAFVEHYYSTFDTSRVNLLGLYQDQSMLTFQGEKVQGAQGIVSKLTSLPFQQCKHNISTVDSQPSGPAGGMLVFVSGNLQLPGEEHALNFSQMFHLIPSAQADLTHTVAEAPAKFLPQNLFKHIEVVIPLNPDHFFRVSVPSLPRFIAKTV